MSLVAAKNFLKFKEAIRRAYPEFTMTRDALTDARDRQSMQFDNIQDLFLSSDFNFSFGVVSSGSAAVCCIVRLERRSILFGHLLPSPSPITRRQLPLSRRVCPACSTVIKSDRQDAVFST